MGWQVLSRCCCARMRFASCRGGACLCVLKPVWMACLSVFHCLNACTYPCLLCQRFSELHLNWAGVVIFIPGDLCSVSFSTAAHCLYSCVFILRMVFVSDLRGLMAALCLFWCVCVFGAGVLPGRFPVWISRCCWAARKANVCYVYICMFVVCVQEKRAVLETFYGSINGKADAKAVTVPQLLTLTACLRVDDAQAAEYYCRGLASVTSFGDESCADVIMSAGCIPHVIDCLRRWPADKFVVYSACWGVYLLAVKGSASVHTVIKSFPGIQGTLQAANDSGLTFYAADALRALDL
jgi:hypothetical protein